MTERERSMPVPVINMIRASTITYGILAALFFYTAATGMVSGIILGLVGSTVFGTIAFVVGLVHGILGYLVHVYAQNRT